MITGVLLRNFKNYNNVNFIPICNNDEYKFTAYIGNNGVGKSAVLESLDVFFNEREWNITFGAKGREAYICPMFLVEKRRITEKGINKSLLEAVSEYFWGADKTTNANFNTVTGLKKWLEYRDLLKSKYKDSHYLLLIGKGYAAQKDAYFATFDEDLKSKISHIVGSNESGKDKVLSDFMQYIKGLYSYIYIPVESSPKELLQLQNHTMQKLLNKDLLGEIEKILDKKNNGNSSIVSQINTSLNSFMDDVNDIISQVDDSYEFINGQRYKKNLRAKDIREKILEAFFPLRTLKFHKLPISQLSSGEQRKAIIDIAYSILVTNGDRKTNKEIVLGIDEPESSMHISNCFKHFQMLENLSSAYDKQIILTTHWYGFLPIAQNGNLNYIENDEQGKRELHSFSLFNLMEEKRNFPDAIELKSMFDLATSIITYMRTDKDTAWIMCEGSDDKLYLECILEGIDKKINILPMGGCGNVIKLYRIIYSSLTDRNEDKDGNILFIIDTDRSQPPLAETLEFSSKKANIKLRRLQIENGIPKLLDPNTRGTYEQTEIEDCLLPQVYYEALRHVISNKREVSLKEIVDNFEVKADAKNSVLRNDGTCLRPKIYEVIDKKDMLVEFAEKDENKKLIAQEYYRIYMEQERKEKHILCEEIKKILEIE